MVAIIAENDHLPKINRELRRLKTQIAALEERKSKLMAGVTR